MRAQKVRRDRHEIVLVNIEHYYAETRLRFYFDARPVDQYLTSYASRYDCPALNHLCQGLAITG